MGLFTLCLLLFMLEGMTFGNRHKASTPSIRTVWGKGLLLDGPHWSPTEKLLYFVDIFGHKIHRLDPATGHVTTRRTYADVTPVVTVRDSPGLVLVCIRSELYLLRWGSPPGDQSLRLLSALDLGLPDNECNDGKVDVRGTFWIGTRGKIVSGTNAVPDQGSLYAVTEDNYRHPDVKLRPVTFSNGLTWSVDNKYMFYIDTPTRKIDKFDYDVHTGGISNRRTLFRFQKYNLTGIPDGMTVDSQGNLWIACYNGGKIIKVDPHRGQLLQEIIMPTSKVTSVMWGGEGLSTLYVTSGRAGLTAAEEASQPLSGSLFAVEGTGCRGIPEHQFLFRNADAY